MPPNPPAQGWSKDIADCHPKILAAFPLVQKQFVEQNPGCALKVDYTYRGPALQMELFKKGRELKDGLWVLVDQSRKVTDDDGTIKKSHHNVYPSQAADVYITRGGKILWGNEPGAAALYVALARLWEAHGLIAGATWKFNWKDQPHVQVAYEIV